MINTGKFCARSIKTEIFVIRDPEVQYIRVCGNVDRADMTEAEERVVKVLDVLCFTGKRHQKRIRGLSLFLK
jgi:hypothetical protein